MESCVTPLNMSSIALTFWLIFTLFTVFFLLKKNLYNISSEDWKRLQVFSFSSSKSLGRHSKVFDNSIRIAVRYLCWSKANFQTLITLNKVDRHPKPNLKLKVPKYGLKIFSKYCTNCTMAFQFSNTLFSFWIGST